MVLLTLSATIAVFTNYARNLPRDARGTMLGVFACGSQLMAFFFIIMCKNIIATANNVLVPEAPFGALSPVGFMCYIDFLLAIFGAIVYCTSEKKRKGEEKKRKESKKGKNSD